MTKIFGREPAVIGALLSAIIMFIGLFVFPLTVDEQGTLNAIAVAAIGALVGWKVAVDGGLAIITGLLKAALAVALSFGLQWPADKQVAAMTLATAIASFYVRSNVVAPVTTTGADAVVPAAVSK